jgi:hypothetical protein
MASLHVGHDKIIGSTNFYGYKIDHGRTSLDDIVTGMKNYKNKN